MEQGKEKIEFEMQGSMYSKIDLVAKAQVAFNGRAI